MSKLRRLADIYWLPGLFVGLGILCTFLSLLLGNQWQFEHPNTVGLLLILLCFLSTNGSKHKKIRFIFAFTGLLFAAFRIWWFLTKESSDTASAYLHSNPWLSDFLLLPLNYTIATICFFVFQILEEIYETPRNRRIWTSITCMLIFSFVSIGTLRLFFRSGEGFYFFGLARVQPYDALCFQLFAAYYIFRSWFIFYRHWKLFRVSVAISVLGGILLAAISTGIERQIYTVVQNQMERKVIDIQSALKKNVEERLSIISIFGDFLNTVPNPTEKQIYAMMNKLNSSGMEAPAVLFFNRHFELKWIYRDNKFLWGREAQMEILGRLKIFVDYLHQIKKGKKYLSQETAKGHSISFSSPLLKNNRLAGYLVFEDLIQPRIEMFFAKNDFGAFNVYLRSASGTSLLHNEPLIKPVVHLTAELDFLGEPLILTVSPNRALAFNTVLIPQLSFLAVGLLITIVLVYTVYVNRKRVHDVEKEVQDRIRDMKVLKEEADRAKLIAEHASYSKSQFLANMSHEIRTPLNVLLGASELLSETKLNSEQKKFVEMFQTSGKHLLGLLNDIIDLSRIESGQLETEEIAFDLLKTLDFVEKLFSLKAQEQGLQFYVETDRIKSAIRKGDPLRIRQILVNLIGNSFKFTKEGTISLTVEELDSQVIQFVVHDTGAGIPEDKQKEIFETFQQGDVSMSRKHGGAGLGLAITKNLCELMGGTIDLQSQVGNGSRFIVRIPLPVTEEAPVKMESHELEEIVETENFADYPQDAQVTQPKKVLLVDDSDDNRFLVRLFLENSHFEITEARNGQEAVQLVQNNTYDIILMDMQMPVMDGYEAVKTIRQYEALDHEASKVPILALTAHGTSIEKNRCLEIGCTDYLSKPVSKNILIHRISDMTHQSQA